MAHGIVYDRLIGPNSVSSGSDVTSTTLTVTSETAPSATVVDVRSYVNLVVLLTGPGDTTTTTPSSMTDTQAASYKLLKEVSFNCYYLSTFLRSSAAPNVSTTITATHHPSKHRIILCDEWYNISSAEHTTSSFSASATTATDFDHFHVGDKNFLVYAVLGLGGAPHADTVNIPDNWQMLHDTGSNYGDGTDVRLIICYQIVNNRTRIEFRPTISNPEVWGGIMFACKVKQ